MLLVKYPHPTWIMKNNWTILILIVLAGLVFTAYGVPWLHSMGRVWVSVFVYAFLVLAFVYSRHSHPGVYRRRPRRSPDQL